MAQNTKEMFKVAYEIYQTNNQDITPLIEMGMNESSAKMTLTWYKHIFKGEFYNRSASEIQIKFILEKLVLDKNKTRLSNVLKSLKIYRKHYPGKYIGQYIQNYEKKLAEFNNQENYYYPDEIENIKNLFEGAKKQITVNAYERNPQARKECIEHYGTICTICNFNFEKIYGEIGKDFIHVHHKKPLSEINENYKINPIEDLIPVCPNCHAMLHKRKPAYGIKEIENLINEKDL